MIKRKIYRSINFIILIYGVFLFYAYHNILKLLSVEQAYKIVILTFTTISVLSIKFFRLYIILFGQSIPVDMQLKQYCKVVPINILFPFKLGELFRIYCYGYHMDSYIEGMIYIVFDRFTDTTALVTIMLGTNFVFGVDSSLILNLLLVFLICIFVLYYVFHPLYLFWNHYFISCEATKRKLAALAFLSKCHGAYVSITKAVKGKFIILYALSLLAWIIELGGVLFLSNYEDSMGIHEILIEYLTAVLTGEADYPYVKQFSFVSIIMLISLYVLLQGRSWMSREKRKRGKNG